MLLFNLCREEERREALVNSLATDEASVLLLAMSWSSPRPDAGQWLSLLMERLVEDGLAPRLLSAVLTPCETEPPHAQRVRAAVYVVEAMRGLCTQPGAEAAGSSAPDAPSSGLDTPWDLDAQGTCAWRDGTASLARALRVLGPRVTPPPASEPERAELGPTDVTWVVRHVVRCLASASASDASSFRQAARERGVAAAAVEVGKRLHVPPQQSQRNPDTVDDQEPHHAWFGFRRDVINLIANLCYGNRETQDEVRENGGIPVVLSACCIDDLNPYIQQHAVWAIRTLTEDNDDNQRAIQELEAHRVESSPEELDRLGLKPHLSEQGTLSLRPEGKPDGAA